MFKTLNLRRLSSLVLLFAAIAVTWVTTAALAKEKKPPKAPDAVDQLNEADVLGEAYIATRFQFVKFEYDGKKEWENHEYLDGSKTLVIKGIDRSQEHTVVLTPRDSGYEGVSVTLKASDFKRAVLKTKGRTQTITFRAYYKPDFKKVDTPKAEPKPKEGADGAAK